MRRLLDVPHKHHTQNHINTVKLELPSISSVHARGPVDTWYQSHYAPKPTVSSERLPALPQIQSHPSASSNSSSPRGGSISSSSVGGGSIGSNTSYAASVHGQHTGYKTPSPEQTHQSLSRDAQPIQSSPFGTQDGYGFVSNGYNSMNQMQSYADVHQSHMATATHAPSSAPPTGLPHYSYPSQQPPMMQPQHQYNQPPPGYPPYGYPGGVPSQIPASSSMNPAMVPSTLQLPGETYTLPTLHQRLTLAAMSSGAPSSTLPGSQSYQTQTFDHTGQVAPPGMKPRVTATLWEDEGSLCFQVEAKGVCVARREGKLCLLNPMKGRELTAIDNHMINGTKLLNVAGMTRGRRDGILKSEKTRHVVKIGPMHLKGVW